MLNLTSCMVKYIYRYLQTKNSCILFIKNRINIDIYIIDIYLIDRYLELISSNNFFMKLFKNTEVFFLMIAYYSTLDLCLYRSRITHAKEILA